MLDISHILPISPRTAGSSTPLSAWTGEASQGAGDAQVERFQQAMHNAAGQVGSQEQTLALDVVETRIVEREIAVTTIPQGEAAPMTALPLVETTITAQRVVMPMQSGATTHVVAEPIVHQEVVEKVVTLASPASVSPVAQPVFSDQEIPLCVQQ